MRATFKNSAWIHLAGIFASFFAFVSASSISRQMSFTSARFPAGNATASSLACNGTLAGTYTTKNPLECGMICAAEPNCESFNFVKNSSASVDTAAGRCEVLSNENATCWYPRNLLERPSENATFYINNNPYTTASDFKLIPAIAFGYNGATQFPWNTDYMNQGGTAGFMVAMRNNSQSSMYTTDFKCRVFRHSFAMSLETPTVVPNSVFGSNMRCPNGSVITAVYDYEANFANANHVRCQKPALPWAVNMTGCRVTNILRLPGNPNLSPMNDLDLRGTADSIWGAQCGTDTKIEALVAIDLDQADGFNEGFECCPLYVSI